MTIFSLIEQRLEHLIEGSTARIFSSEDRSADLAGQLVRAMRTSIREAADGELIAPNLYTLHVTSQQAEVIRSNPGLLEEIAQYLQQVGSDAGLSFLSVPVIKFTEDHEIKGANLFVTADHSLEDISETLDFPAVRESIEHQTPSNAFLIIDGMRVYPLSTKVVNIGRRADNHLVLEDRRVSRQHAQLRVIDGRYVIFDLDSTGGTFLNGERIQKGILKPGDVISLSGVPLVYGQDAVDPGDTQKYNIPPGNEIE